MLGQLSRVGAVQGFWGAEDEDDLDDGSPSLASPGK
jgi:hypothetical protein